MPRYICCKTCRSPYCLHACRVKTLSTWLTLQLCLKTANAAVFYCSVGVHCAGSQFLWHVDGAMNHIQQPSSKPLSSPVDLQTPRRLQADDKHGAIGFLQTNLLCSKACELVYNKNRELEPACSFTTELPFDHGDSTCKPMKISAEVLQVQLEHSGKHQFLMSHNSQDVGSCHSILAAFKGTDELRHWASNLHFAAEVFTHDASFKMCFGSPLVGNPGHINYTRHACLLYPVQEHSVGLCSTHLTQWMHVRCTILRPASVLQLLLQY